MEEAELSVALAQSDQSLGGVEARRCALCRCRGSRDGPRDSLLKLVQSHLGTCVDLNKAYDFRVHRIQCLHLHVQCTDI